MMQADHLAVRSGTSRFTPSVHFRPHDIRSENENLTIHYGTDGNSSVPRNQRGEQADKALPGLSLWRLRKVTDYVEDNLDERISTQFLADLVGLSPGYFCPVFKNTVGLTPQAYVMQQRLRRAQNLLKSNTEMALIEIAFSCGFTDQSHLNNRFKSAFGVSPGNLRKALKKSDDAFWVMAVVNVSLA